jgi:SNF2 family DNA or RNA helicase
LRISKVLGSEKQRLAALRMPADIYIINRENVEWLVDRHAKCWLWDMVVIDELSSFKSTKANRFRALRKVRPLIKRIVGLTGTPAPNGLLDLWPQVYLLDMGQRLGQTVTGYRDRYFVPDKRDRNRGIVFTWKAKPEAESAIYTQISDICVSMKSCDYLTLPDRVDNIIPVKLSDAELSVYKQLERDLILTFDEGDVVAGNAAVLTNKLLQMCNGAIYDEFRCVREMHRAKLDALADVVEAANGKPIMVFYTYKHDLERIASAFPGARKLESSQDIADWNSGSVPLMLAHPMSAGHGLNLQDGGNTICWFGLPWSLEQYQQANARLHRQGQRNTVFIHHLVAEGTMDEVVMDALKNKAVGQDALLAALKARIGV